MGWHLVEKKLKCDGNAGHQTSLQPQYAGMKVDQNPENILNILNVPAYTLTKAGKFLYIIFEARIQLRLRSWSETPRMVDSDHSNSCMPHGIGHNLVSRGQFNVGSISNTFPDMVIFSVYFKLWSKQKQLNLKLEFLSLHFTHPWIRLVSGISSAPPPPHQILL